MIELEPDLPPRSGGWLDGHDFLEALSNEDRIAGQRLGERIDTSDDEDSGGYR